MDLTSTVARCIEKFGWSEEFARKIEADYRFFFIGDHVAEPSTLVDLMWHEHILDTRKYAQDCENVLGTFLHHVPVAGRCRKSIAA